MYVMKRVSVEEKKTSSDLTDVQKAFEAAKAALQQRIKQEVTWVESEKADVIGIKEQQESRKGNDSEQSGNAPSP